MNLINHKILTTNPGVLAVLSAPVTAAGDEIPDMTTYGADRWHPIMRGTALLLRHTSETELRVVVGDHLVIVQVEGEQIVAVIVESGHAVNKSIHRMIRQSVRAHKTKTQPTPRPADRGAAPGRPPADRVKPAPFTVPGHVGTNIGGAAYMGDLSESERAAVVASQGSGIVAGSPRGTVTEKPTPAIEMPRGDQW